MNRRRMLILFLLGLAVVTAVGLLQRTPGYMDAAYYQATAQMLAEGKGFTEPFIWTYFGDPAGIPHPSHLYWMPLPSLLAAGSMIVLGLTWRAAQLPFLLLGALLPVITAAVAETFTSDERMVWTSGLLALFPGFFLPYLGTTDSFALYALLGSVLLLILSPERVSSRRLVLAGLLIACAHLTRADGLLFFLPAIAAILTGKHRRISGLVALILGYVAGMTPWWIRNLMTIGSLMPETSYAFWLTTYDDLFAFPASRITLQAWLESGWRAILEARMDALLVNGQRVIAEVGMVFLLPFTLIGGWQWRRQRIVWLGGLYFAGLFALMTLVFPFAGANGGLFHSSAAVLPLTMALTPYGIRSAVAWLSRRRHWTGDEAERVFLAASVVILAALTVWNADRRIGFTPPGSAWSQSDEEYDRYASAVAGEHLPGIGAINNPPGYFVAGGQSTVVIPNGNQNVLRNVVEAYGVEWVLLEPNHPRGLHELYQNPESVSWLDLRVTLRDSMERPVYLYVVE